MENEKQNKQNKVKKVIFEVVYWVALGLALIFALCIGAHQSKTWDSIENRLSNIEQQINKEENAIARQEVRRALPLRDSAVTDLTGTSWELNERPNIASGNDWVIVGNTPFNINFTSNNTNFDSIVLDDDDEGIINYITYFSNNVATYPAVGNISLNSGYMKSEYRNISISGGTDVTNNSLIGWLIANATQTGGGDIEPEPEPVGISYSLEKRYDFRKWFGEVDPLTGCIKYQYQTGDNQKVYDIGSLQVGGIEYKYLCVAMLEVNNAINIITGYDYQEQCYLAVGGADYYNGASGYSLILSIELRDQTTAVLSNNRLKLYEVPLVGARLMYDNQTIIPSSDYVPATGYLCATFELKTTAINWDNYIPSDTTYNLPGIGGNYTIYEVLQLDLYNDTYLDFYSISASATGGNVFTLLGNAFKVIGNLLSIQIIPGVSIGLLVVLPITATILIVVIKLVRK